MWNMFRFRASLTTFLNSHSETSSYFHALPSYPPAPLGECQHPDPASQSDPVWEDLREKHARSSTGMKLSSHHRLGDCIVKLGWGQASLRTRRPLAWLAGVGPMKGMVSDPVFQAGLEQCTWMQLCPAVP